MCHSRKHMASICIQDNQTCHVNFIPCLLTLFVMSLFFLLSCLSFPPLSNSRLKLLQCPLQLFRNLNPLSYLDSKMCYFKSTLCYIISSILLCFILFTLPTFPALTFSSPCTTLFLSHLLLDFTCSHWWFTTVYFSVLYVCICLCDSNIYFSIYYSLEMKGMKLYIKKTTTIKVSNYRSIQQCKQ